MKETYLFDMTIDPKSLLADMSQRGFVFLTPKQVCSITDKTWGMIRYAALNYALDAYLIKGNFRFTISAVEDYLDNVEESFEKAYHDSISRREIYGAYALREGSVEPLVTSLKSHGIPMTSIDDLMDIRLPEPYEMQPSGETELDDFYGIDSLDLPDELPVWHLADVLQIPEEVICEDMGVSKTDVLEYMSVYDWLVSKQLVNANIGDKVALSQSNDNLSKQGFLDL